MVKANSSFDPDTKLALEDCKELLDDAVQELQASFALVGEGTLHTMDQRIAELQNWLSAVVTYQQTCQDQFGDPNSQYKTSMKDGMIDAGQLTSNALAIVNALSNILSSFGLKFDFGTDSKNNTQRLLSVGEDGYPMYGDFKTITEALASIPPKNVAPFIVYVKAGIYKDYVSVDKKEALGEGFTARSMAFENTAGPEGHQAVALRVQADKAAFFDCKIHGYQGTLYIQAHRQFFSNCTISGTIDFIFGDASCVIQNSLIVVNRPLNNQFNAVTAQGRSIRHQTTGLVLHNCKIVAEDKLFPDKTSILSYLGSPGRSSQVQSSWNKKLQMPFTQMGGCHGMEICTLTPWSLLSMAIPVREPPPIRGSNGRVSGS
ncbi:hypothetical protein GH714_004488 [Hevea brasiliensis]|uniref:Pectinesterase n=1 Tax=Hevea brasiliensis TaxID=3981 RepID=A0A6A6KXK2_HEVBR|nr:hypothetical protein GH714_004488 [Hevea brasiliensis]